MVAREKATPCDQKDALTRIHLTTEIGDLYGCQIAVGAIVKNFEMRVNLLRQLDTIRSEETIVATNSSSISVTRIAALS